MINIPEKGLEKNTAEGHSLWYIYLSFPHLQLSLLIPNLFPRLSHLAASWGGKENGFGLSKYCSNDPISTFHFEFYAEVSGEGKKCDKSTSVTVIHLDNVDKMDKTPAAIMEELLQQFSVPEDKQVSHCGQDLCILG